MMAQSLYTKNIILLFSCHSERRTDFILICVKRRTDFISPSREIFNLWAVSWLVVININTVYWSRRYR